jgi:hypothetical protein
MAGKSLDEIWRQMQSQRQAEIARQQAQERAINEQRERSRQEYLRSMRMYEKIGPNNPSAASAAAGSGGGRLPQNNVSVSNQATLHWSYDGDAKILYYFVYNFGTKELSEIKQVSLDESPSEYPVTEGGFFLTSNNNESSTIDLLFIDLNANIIWQDSTDNQNDVDIENFSRYIGAYYLKDGNWKLVLFDKDSTIKTFNFGEYQIEGGEYSYNDVWSGGIVVAEYIGDIRRYWIINFSEGTKTQFYQVNTNLGEYLNVYQYAYSNKILTRKNGDLWEVFSSTGVKLAEFDAISTFATTEWYDNEFTFLDDNGSFLIAAYDNTNDNRTITLFSGSTNTFSSKVIDRSVYSEYDADVYYQKDYYSTNDWNAGGSAIFLFYDTSYEPDDIRYYSPEGLLLPIWSTDTELRDFYTFSNTRGINDNLDDSNIAFTRSADHICLLVDNDPGDENYSILRFNREGDVVTVIPTDINKSRDLDDDDQINGKTILQFERGLTVSGTWGWEDLSDVEDRFYYSLRSSADGNFNNLVNQNIEVVMKDTTSDQYWAFNFTYWQGGGGGGFAYTRQLIEAGTFSGEVVAFTHSNYLTSEPDVIVPGVLEIKRGEYGPIYNAAKEGESNGYNPTGTLWNSQYSYNIQSIYNYKWWYTDGIASNPTNSTDFNAIFSGSPEDTGREYNNNIDWSEESGKPYYLPATDFAWQVDCLLKVEVSGTYLFRTTSDDGNQLTIDGNVVTEFYGGRGIGTYDTSNPVNLSLGLHTFRYRMQQGDGESGSRVEWQGPGDGTFSVIPASNLVINDIITEYDHYIVGTDGQIIGSVSTGNEYSNDYEGKTYFLEDQVFNKSWISNTENSENWTLLDKYYDENEDVNNIVTEDGIRKGIYLLQNGFDYRIITEDGHQATFSVPFTGNFLNKIDTDDVFHKGAFVYSKDDTNSWLRFYDIEGNLIDTIEKSGQFDNFDSWVYGDRCVLSWDDNTRRFAFFNGESVQQFDSGREYWDTSVNDYIWWD